MSEPTVKKYLFRIFDKLGVSSRVELVLYAVKNGDPLPAEWLAGVGRSHPSKDSTPAAPSQFGKPSVPPV